MKFESLQSGKWHLSREPSGDAFRICLSLHNEFITAVPPEILVKDFESSEIALIQIQEDLREVDCESPWSIVQPLLKAAAAKLRYLRPIKKEIQDVETEPELRRDPDPQEISKRTQRKTKK